MSRQSLLLVAAVGLVAALAGCKRVATIEVYSTPEGANVFLDGESTGFVTPHTFADVYAGYHIVEVRSQYSKWSESFSLRRNEVRTVNALLAAVRWHFQGDAYYLRHPAVADDGTVYLTTDDSLCSLDSTGAIRWMVRCADPYGSYASAPAVGDDGTVYVVAYDSLRAFRSDGTLAWGYRLQGGDTLPPALGPDGTIYLVCDDSLLAISSSGARRWAFRHGESHAAPPAVGADGTVYLRTSSGIHALSTNGMRKWRYDLYSYGSGPLAIGPDSTIYAAYSYNLIAISPGGSLLWEITPDQSYSYASGLAVGPDGTVYLGTGHRFVAVSRQGAVLWGYEGVSATSAPALSSDGLVYAARGSSSGFVCLTTDGEERWTFTPQDYYGGYVAGIGADGTLYWVSGNGMLYAVIGTAGPPDSGWPMYQHDLRHTGRAR